MEGGGKEGILAVGGGGGGDVKLVAGRQEGSGWLCWLYRVYFTPPERDRSEVSF